MASRRRAPPRPRRAKQDEAEAEPGDLFAHFGVELERAGRPAEIRAGRACSGCGWLLRVELDRRCPLCGRAAPSTITD